VSLVLLLGGIALALVRLARPATPRPVRVRLLGLFVWLLLPAALSVRHQSDLHPHYFLMTLPAALLLIGAGAQWLASGLGRSVMAACAVGLGLLMVVQTAAVGGLLGLVASTPQACFGAPLGVNRQTAADLLAFGAPAERVVFENDEAGDASAIAYLVRPGFKQIVVPQPDLATLTGPGVPSAAAARAPGPLMQSAERVGLLFGPGVSLEAASMATDPWPGWRPRLAFTWTADPPAPAPLVWQADLLDAGGTPLLSTRGQQHTASGTVLSVFSFDVPGSLPPAEYQARLRLTGSSAEWLSPPVHVAPPPSCVRSVMP
jgi:hypothetical protein